MSFTLSALPDLSGRLAVITGATGGLGLETALALAGAKATVVLTGRNDAKGAAALMRVHQLHPGADVSYETLDLGSLDSVSAFVARFTARHDRLDVLVNNAGVMMPPDRQITADGFELQFGTNHLAHFALTAELLPQLRAAAAPRVVSVASLAHRMGVIRFRDLQWTRGYNPNIAYGQSKLANLLFAAELQRRSDAGGWGLASIAAHPGVSTTDLIANGPGSAGSGLGAAAARFVTNRFGHDPAHGALPQIFAAASPQAKAGAYYGPTGFMEFSGVAGEVGTSRRARNTADARRLWEISEELTGRRFPSAAA